MIIIPYSVMLRSVPCSVFRVPDSMFLLLSLVPGNEVGHLVTYADYK